MLVLLLALVTVAGLLLAQVLPTRVDDLLQRLEAAWRAANLAWHSTTP